MSARIAACFYLIQLALLLLASAAQGQDIFQTERAIPAAPGSPIAQGNDLQIDPLRDLTLEQAVDKGLQNNPQTRQAWSDIKVQAAGVGVAQSAYLPTISGTVQGTRDVSTTKVGAQPSLDEDTWSTQNSETASLSWLIYDFGGREANVANAKALVLAAQATHQSTLQEVFFTIVKDYYSAQAARESYSTSIENEKTAQTSLNAASTRVEKGIAPVTDQLQAKNAYVQAVVNETKAKGAWNTAAGTLASDMGIRPDTHINLPNVEDELIPGDEFKKSISQLITDAVMGHPSVLAAEAKLRAAQEEVKKTRDGGLPSISMIGKATRSDQPVSQSLGLPEYDSTERDTYIGVQMSMPFFEGFSRTYQIRQAEAQVESQRHALEQVQQQVSLQVWTSYQSLQTSTENVENNLQLLEVAQLSHEAAKGRYQGGVGTIIELLDTQAALASARLQRVQSLTDWRTSRLQLISSLGQLGIWRIKEQ